MIKILINNGEIKIQGTFDMGYMGVYTDDEISFTDSLDEIKEFWDILLDNDNLDIDSCADEDIADFLTEYFNHFEKKIQQNRKQVNDNFLINVFSNMADCGLEFWENERITIHDKLPSDPEKEVYNPYWDEMDKIVAEYDDTPNDGSIKKTDVEAAIRKNFPMLDLDALLASIEPECLTLNDGGISFQCSDNFDFEHKIMCAAYDELDENLAFTDWHNF